MWATGWEERANEHLPYLLKLPFKDLPCLTFDGRAMFGSSHWKVDAINEYAADRPAAWIDDNMNEECQAWADRRSAPTLLVETSPSEGLTDEHVDQLRDWAQKQRDASYVTGTSGPRRCFRGRGAPGLVDRCRGRPHGRSARRLATQTKRPPRS